MEIEERNTRVKNSPICSCIQKLLVIPLSQEMWLWINAICLTTSLQRILNNCAFIHIMNYVLFILVIAGSVVIYTLMLTPQITPPSSLSSQTPPGHPEFVGVDSKYVCVLCNNVLQDAVQTPCGHRLCQPCVDTYLQDGQPRLCPYQEEFCEMLQADQVSRGSAHCFFIKPVYGYLFLFY